MTTTSATNTAQSTLPTSLLNGGSTKSDKSTEASDRFLKLLVTQMQNQDPLNPMDNAQVTSQMAQINTVTGIEKLNTTVGGLNASFSQMQTLQSVSLVGRSVLMEGNKLAVTEEGKGSGGFELTSAASNVTVEIKSANGTVLKTMELGAKAAGQHGFDWDLPEGTQASGLTFSVKAVAGKTELSTTPLMTDLVDAVASKDGTLTLQLRNSGDTAYSKIKAMA